MIQDEENKYLFMPSDRSLTYSYIKEYKPIEKELKITMELYSEENNAMLAACEFILEKNNSTSNITYDYYYNIKSIEILK